MASYPSEKATAPSGQVDMPLRQASGSSAVSDDAVPTSDPRDTSELLAERLQAWKHAVGYLENYVSATEKVEKAHSKEYEKVLKTISDPLREGNHFDQSLGGIAGLFENMRANTQGLINSHADTEKNLKGSVLPILDRLHKEIKNKSKELASGASKSAKEVDKARNSTQKQIELLGQRTAGYDSSFGKITASEDPYVIQRGVYHRLHKQVLEENNNRQDLISVQNNFATFEQHIIEVIQQAMASFNQFVGGQAQQDQTMYADMLATAQRIPHDFEWKGFVDRNGNLLIDPNGATRSVDHITFPNQNHKATQPLIEGTLERKSRNKLSTGYSTGYYVVTASGFLHEFKDNDNIRKDPSSELSIYLPDAVVGATNGPKFNVKGKDVSKSLSSKLTGSSELAFKAHTAQDAEQWSEIIRMVAGNPATEPYSSLPNSPIEKRQTSVGTLGAGGVAAAEQGPAVSGGTAPPPQQIEAAPAAIAAKPQPLQTTGITGGEAVASPATATLATATAATPATQAASMPASATATGPPAVIKE